MGPGVAEKTFLGAGSGGAPAARGGEVPLVLSPVVVCFVLLSLYMATMVFLGSPLNGDVDDVVKLHELRVFIATGNVFDRTLPGILQPEPYVSHWPWITDLPYALVAWPLVPVLGFEAALSVACYVVPLILLAPSLYCYGRLVTAVGFKDTIPPLAVAVILAAVGFFEFAPGRIDYHNLQIMLFFAALVLVLSRHRLAAFANGLVVALALAVSFEFAVFHALVMGVYAFDFVFAGKDGAARLRDFGAGLAAGALFLFVVTVPPSAYAIGKCDTYSAPYALALVLAGSAFAGLSAMGEARGLRLVRALALCGLAVASVALVLALYPQCAGGPYGEMSARLREAALAYIPQEKSFLHRPDFILSDSLPAMVILFAGALAPAVCWLGGRRERPLAVVALASIVALVQALAYFRYLRYLPFFSSIGLVFVAAALLPPGRQGILVAAPGFGCGPRHALRLVAPGLGLSAALVLFCLAAKPAAPPASVFDLTDFCGAASAQRLAWPDGTVVLAPPVLGAGLVARPAHPAVVAIPNHHAAQGMERIDRFLDPGAGDPRPALDESRATHVVVCAAPANLQPALRRHFGFAAALMEGHAPEWLAACPPQADSPLRIYAYRQADGSPAACPAASAP